MAQKSPIPKVINLVHKTGGLFTRKKTGGGIDSDQKTCNANTSIHQPKKNPLNVNQTFRGQTLRGQTSICEKDPAVKDFVAEIT